MEFDAFFETATGNPPYAYQRIFAKSLAFPDLLEAPTGCGKTAAAVLGWLWRRRHGTPAQRTEAGRRLVFCLPMRTLVEQTAGAAAKWRDRLKLTPEGLRIATLLGGAIDDEWDEHPDQDTIVIGTQDQLLSRALMRGYAMSRYRWPVAFALLNNDSTWVIDEVQLMGVGASTAAQLQAFRESFRVFGGARTVWMSATLDEGRLHTVDARRTLIRQPFTAPEPSLQQRLQAPKTLGKAAGIIGRKQRLDTVAEEIAAAHVAGTLTLVVLNRVARAQELYRRLRGGGSVDAVALIHSRFRAGDRKRIQAEVLDGRFHGVLVSTQAIEAGVDISARTLFTELAPWSSLVQRFGRLNRAGEHADARALWIDVDTADPEACRPYESSALIAARAKLTSLADVGPTSLKTVPAEPQEPILPVLRRKDLLELFDTEPDLAGHDIDVSMYIRATDERDVQVGWRALHGDPPADSAPDLHRDELCSVPVYQLRNLAAKGSRIWRFDALRSKDKWVEVEPDRLFPGLAVLVDVATGGYTAELGFTGDKTDVPRPVDAHGSSPECDEDDHFTTGADFVLLRQHTDDVVHELGQLLAGLDGALGDSTIAATLADAARWHDRGKAHDAFQAMLVSALPEGDARRKAGPWAKSDGSRGTRNIRRFFRHELASALAWIAEGKSNLGAFIIAAHHGKVRLSLRARPREEPPPDAMSRRFAHGVWDGDMLPESDLGGGVAVPEQVLSLTCMDVGVTEGESWADRMVALLEEFGPFRLAYLEMLLRVADWRASARVGAAALSGESR